MTSTSRVAIVGGGLAGLATAAALAERGVPSVLLESRPRLGGRASSFHDAATDTWIDNCQHVSMGCCTNFQHFCERTGLAEFFRIEPALYFIGPKGRIDRFSSGSWPAPLHLAGAFAGLSFLSWSDKFALARGLRALATERSAPSKESFSTWLERHHQPPRAIWCFWHVVLVSALSESLGRISVPAARKVFIDGFLAHRDGWQVCIPTVPLEVLYGGRLMQWLTERGVDVRLQSAAESLEIADERVDAVRLKSGERLAGDEFVVAVPFHRVRALLPESHVNHPSLAGLDRLEAAPISSVHLWFDRPITDLPHAVFVTGLCQWLFNRGASRERELPETSLAGADSGSLRSRLALESHYYQVVISASREVVGRESADVLRQVLDELAAVWPVVKEATLLHSRQVTEHRAVFSPLPGSDDLRPVQQSHIVNLQFAGDWTRTGWPATMESAVRSGYLAAENLLRRLGRPAAVLQPDLPSSALFRRLFPRD